MPLPERLSDLITFDPNTGSVSSRESKKLEFKQSFNLNDFSDYTKILASFSNSLGGAIVFGVSDSPRHIVGDAPPLDEARWADRLRDDFDPEIAFSIRTYQIGENTITAVSVDTCPHLPVICKKGRSKVVQDRKGEKRDIEVIREGSIYYRYAGQTRTIRFPELHSMLAERETRYLKSVMETLQVMQKVGIENTGIIDVTAPKSSVYLSKETAKGLSFIDKGRLVQNAGAPAYVVMGNIDLRQIHHAPLQEEDKNLPTEAAKILSAIVKEIFGIERIAASQVTQLLRHLKIDGDNHHCVHEKKMGRKYVTRAGIEAVAVFIKEKPQEALSVFGSKAANQRYSASNPKSEINRLEFEKKDSIQSAEGVNAA